MPPWKPVDSSHKPAYSSVAVNHSLAPKKEMAQTAPSSKPAGAPSSQWPDSLKVYVGRCFENVTPAQRVLIESSLKQIITAELEAGTLWDVDWDNRPLPLAKSEENEDGEREVIKAKGLPKIHLKAASNTNTQELDQIKKRSSRWDQTSKDADADKGEKEPKRKNITFNPSLREIDPAKKEQRARRFDLERPAVARPSSSTPEYSGSVLMEDSEPDQFVGRCMKLEKKYLRLTAAPDPETVRPLHVLRQTLSLLKQKWSTDRNYAYICDQFKSMRQDLTVQRIQNEFTVNVYEIHARIALENNDLGEYNQCQTQLRSLYALGIPGHPKEFTAYRILYLLHTRNRTDMNDVLIELTDEEKADEAIAHALQVRNAVEDNEYHALMRLNQTAPNMGGYIMDSFIEREKIAAMEIICKAYRPDVPLRFLSDEVGFESDGACVEFLDRNSLSQFLDPDTLKLHTKEAYPVAMHNRITAFKKIDIKGQI